MPQLECLNTPVPVELVLDAARKDYCPVHRHPLYVKYIEETHSLLMSVTLTAEAAIDISAAKAAMQRNPTTSVENDGLCLDGMYEGTITRAIRQLNGVFISDYTIDAETGQLRRHQMDCKVRLLNPMLFTMLIPQGCILTFLGHGALHQLGCRRSQRRMNSGILFWITCNLTQLTGTTGVLVFKTSSFGIIQLSEGVAGGIWAAAEIYHVDVETREQGSICHGGNGSSMGFRTSWSRVRKIVRSQT